MAENSPYEYLAREIEKYINIFDHKRQKNKFLALGIRLFNTTVAGAITVLLGLSIPQKSMTYNNTALTLSALMTVAAAWDGFFNHKALWVRFTIATNALRSLKQELDYIIAKGTDSTDTQESDRIQMSLAAIIRQTNESWEALKRDDDVSTKSQQSLAPRARGNLK